MEEAEGSQRRGIPRSLVSTVVEQLLADREVKWLAILHEDTISDVDRFRVVAYTEDPTT